MALAVTACVFLFGFLVAALLKAADYRAELRVKKEELAAANFAHQQDLASFQKERLINEYFKTLDADSLDQLAERLRSKKKPT